MGDEGNNVLGGEGGGLELYDRQIAKDAEEYWPEKRLRVCITGAGGFIASHLARRLKKEGHYIVAVDWKRNEHMTVCVCTRRSMHLFPPSLSSLPRTHTEREREYR